MSVSEHGMYCIVVAVAQYVERVVYQSEGWWFNSQLLQSTCRSVLEWDTEPQIAPDSCATGL